MTGRGWTTPRSPTTLAAVRRLLPLLLLFGCAPPAADAPTEPTPEPTLPVAVATVVAGTVHDPVSVTGTLRPHRSVVVAAEGAGRVSSVQVALGDLVRRGDTLARLDSTAARAQAAQARAAARSAEAVLAIAQSSFDQLDALLGEGASTETEHLQARLNLEAQAAQLEAANASVQLAEKALADTTLRAPFDGAVASVQLEVGGLIAPGTPAFSIVDLSVIEVVAGLPARQVERVELGQVARVELPNRGGMVVEGTVGHLGPDVDPRTRTWPVEIRLDNADGALRAGTVARVEILVAQRDGVPLVPESALVNGDPLQVFVVADGVAHARTVQRGQVSGDLVEVVGDVPIGADVATFGRQGLSDGVRVEVRPLGGG